MNIFCNWLLITALASLLVPVPSAASHSDGNPEGENFKSRPETLEAEVLGALDDFDARLIDLSDLTGNKPLAWYMEASWQAADGLLLTGRYEQARDFQDDIVRYGISGSYDLFSNTVIALEYLHAQPDTDPKSDTLTGQLAFEF